MIERRTASGLIIEESLFSQEWISTGRKILITGSTGLVGSCLAQTARGKDEIFGLSRGKIESSFANDQFTAFNCDLLNEEELWSLFEKVKPQVVIHLAAATDVDGCQNNPDWAKMQNVEATKLLARACKEYGTILGYCSTDYIFPKTGGPFSEKDKTDPINIYGRTKLEGEKAIKEILVKGQYFIFRIASPYDFAYLRKPGTPPIIYKCLQENKSLKLVNDAFTTYTWVPDIALALNRLILEEVWNKSRPIYHIAGPESLSATQVAWACLIRLDKKVFTGQIDGVALNEYFRGKAPRPLEGGLKIGKITDLGIKMHSLEEVLKTTP